MGIPANFCKVQIAASLIGGEQMVHSVFVKDVQNLATPDLQALATGVRDKWSNFLNTPVPGLGFVRDRLHTGTVYNKVTAYRLNGVNGTATDIKEAGFVSNNAGTRDAGNPTELAMCCTLLTGQPGRSSRGRMYLGGFASSQTLLADGRINAFAAEEIAKALARFFREVRDIGAVPGAQDLWEPQVVSQKNTTARKITEVSVGNVWDVQRRRRNKLVEVRTAALVN